jgi:hypothetical protein
VIGSEVNGPRSRDRIAKTHHAAKKAGTIAAMSVSMGRAMRVGIANADRTAAIGSVHRSGTGVKRGPPPMTKTGLRRFR